MKKLAIAIALMGLAILTFAPAAHATGDNNPDKVWVCKYVGQPGDFETLKDGKQPIQVDDASTGGNDYVGADFADGQFHSVVIDVVTADNTDEHNDYTGEATCPVPESTTTTTVAPSTTTSAPTTSVPVTSTTVAETTTTQPPETTSVPTTTVAPPTTTTEVTTSVPPSTVPTTTSSTPSPSTTLPVPTTVAPKTSTTLPRSTSTRPSPSSTTPASPSKPLPFTGSDTGAWVAIGVALLLLGAALLAMSRQARRKPMYPAHMLDGRRRQGK